jgi:flagellar assembly protein FliH
MSEVWETDLLGDAVPVGAWARPAASGQFTPWTGGGHPHRRASDRADFTPRGSAAPQPTENEPVDLEAIRAEAFAEGFERGRETIAMEMSGERAALAKLIHSAEALQPENHGALATILAETVTRLVRQVVGEVQIDTETLRARAEAVAELVTAEAGPARLRLHPDDVARLSYFDFGVPIASDHHLQPGTIMLETAEGWIEDGPQVRIARLRTQLDSMGLPR